jgi:hypothetical protein
MYTNPKKIWDVPHDQNSQSYNEPAGNKNDRYVEEEEDDDDDVPELITYEVEDEANRRFKFDAEITHEDEFSYYLAVAPRRVQGEYMGCVYMRFDPSIGGDPIVNILRVSFDEECSAKETSPLVRKDGTRAMLLGALHVVMSIAEQRRGWSHLKLFVLNDDSKFPCIPTSRKVRTIVADALLRDDVYYERRINARPVDANVSRAIEAVRARMRTPVDVSGKRFVKRMGEGIAVTSSNADDQTDAVRNIREKWLSGNLRSVDDIVEEHRRSGKTWRELFAALHAEYGCAFFSSCEQQLVEMFKMKRLVGALYQVAFKDVPRSVAVHVTIGGGGVAALRRRKERMATVRTRAFREWYANSSDARWVRYTELQTN